jgi:Cft2 family RNA processing exonuclease
MPLLPHREPQGYTRTSEVNRKHGEQGFAFGAEPIRGLMTDIMRITNLNPDHDIGASAWVVDLEGYRILLDAGVHPKREGRDSLPLFAKAGKGDIDAIILSHCHHDHVGALPVALKTYPHAHVLMTELSYFLVERILHNSVNVMQRQREELGIREYPLYTHEEVDEYAAVFQGYRYRREITWSPPHNARKGAQAPTVEFFDAGHTLGSAGVLLRGEAQTVFYTGDVCFHDQTILRAAQFGEVKADVMIMETTRGGRAKPPGYTRPGEVQRLQKAISEVFKAKGSVLIPAFGLGRTQEVLAMLALMMRDGRLKRQPVYIGGLGRVFTEIYDLEAHRANRQHASLKLTEALDLQVMSPNQVPAMKLGGGHLFVLTSGMMSPNTAAHDLALRMLPDERHGIFFVGYADPETPGGRVKASRAGQEFWFSEPGGHTKRRCRMEDFDLTAHAHREDLMELVGQVDPRVVVLGHGDEAAREWFAGEIRRLYPRIKVHSPGPAQAVEA